MGNTKSNAMELSQATLFNEDVIKSLQRACSKTTKQELSLSMTSNKIGNVLIASQDPHIVLSVVEYYKKLTDKTIQTSKGACTLVYKIQLYGASDFAMKGGFGEDWTIIFIDFMRQTHPNYKMIAASMDVAYRLQKLYFVPQNNYKQNIMMDNDVKDNDSDNSNNKNVVANTTDQ
eukprot:201534_1